MVLEEYSSKRDFKKTPEPKPQKTGESRGLLVFIVQKHQASHLHYDLRLELNGVLKSWAIPKGPSLNPEEKHLAVMVEDHPFDYRNFEGVIPKGNYGAGTVMIWDEGTYELREPASAGKEEEAIEKALQKGHLTFLLHGKKLKGEFALIKTKRGEKDWLLIKKHDDFATNEDIRKEDRSARTGRSMEEIASQGPFYDEKEPIPGLEGVDLSGAIQSPMPHDVKPMLSTLVSESFDRPGWLYEIKWDGYRAIAEISREGIRLYSRNNKTLNQDYTALVNELRRLPYEAVFDGEIVVVDETGKANFQLIQNYKGMGQGFLIYYAFDLLWFNGCDLQGLPLIRRKEVLRRILPDSPLIRFSSHVEDGVALFKAVSEQGIEGIMAKDASSTYQPGIRGRNWLKIKATLEQEAVIGGFTETRGGRTGFGALVLGVYEGDELKYIGHTGTGFDENTIRKVLEKLQPLSTKDSPFKLPPKTNTPVTWVVPNLVCEVRFSEWTESGQMRHPVFLGLREDLNPKEVKREMPSPAKDNTSFLSAEDEQKIEVDGRQLILTNLNKVYWPEERYEKRDLIEYYYHMAPVILPHLRDRPESLHRHPNGIDNPGFFQKDMDSKHPDWAQTFCIYSESSEKDINYLLCQDKPTLIYMANLGCIEINPWMSRIQDTEKPDYLIFDLDPLDIEFDKVVQVAQVLREVLEKVEAPGYCKTSGATGLHIYLPLGAKYTYDQIQQFAMIVALYTHNRLPGSTSVERSPAKREKKVYIDTLQNRRGQTVAAPYSVRPRPKATVSAPLKWEELTTHLRPEDFHIKNMQQRLDKVGDLWKGTLGPGIDMEKSLELLDKMR